MIDFSKPSTLKVIKRTGKLVAYDFTKIQTALNKAFEAVYKDIVAHSAPMQQRIQKLSEELYQYFEQNFASEAVIKLENIQDQVEKTLMEGGELEVLRAYVLYRNKRQKARAKNLQEPVLEVRLEDGSLQPLDLAALKKSIQNHCSDLPGTDANIVFEQTRQSLHNEIPIDKVHQARIMVSRALIEQDPAYSLLTARFLLDKIYAESCLALGLSSIQSQEDYSNYFKHYILKGIELELLDPKLQTFDLDILSKALNIKQDLQFKYISLQPLYDRYFLKNREGINLELPQAFLMRIAMGLALAEDQYSSSSSIDSKNKWAIEFYKLMSSFKYMPSTPTLFNAGTVRPQLSSCFLTTIPDDLQGIFHNGLTNNVMLSKYAGGLGNDWTAVRARGSLIKGTNGKSQGIVPFLNVADAATVAVNQGGKRKGAVCAYLEPWHLDVEEFLELRKNTGDDRRRTHDMNTALWVPDLLMKRVREKGAWTLFSPDETPDLHELFGLAFEKRYAEYESKASEGKLKNYKQLSAVSFWRKMLSALFETGHPWITFKDACNLRSPQQHQGVIHSSNLCTEITLNTSKDEIAVCNLGSINLPKHLTKEGTLDIAEIKKTVTLAMRMLDNVIDINYYSVPEAKTANLKHRPVGLGVMGFQDVLFENKLAFNDPKTIELADRSMELISYYAIDASCALAKERGEYASFQGSLWHQGILPIDSIELLQKARGEYLQQNRDQTLDWNTLRTKVMKQGMRNSNCLAIAPTATISNICNVTPSIEPAYQNLFVKSNMSGEFTVINEYLVKDLKALGLWDESMVQDLKYYDGSIQSIERIPDALKAIYATAFEIDIECLLEAASRRQKWLDQSQSLNAFISEPSGKKLETYYQKSWLKGIKTNYYLRTLGKSHLEKSTASKSVLNSVPVAPVIPMQKQAVQSCAIEDESCEVCQ